MLSLKRGQEAEEEPEELQLLSAVAVPRNHPWKRSEYQKENKVMARQHGDVREKFCQAHRSAGGVIVLVYRGGGGVPIQGLYGWHHLV